MNNHPSLYILDVKHLKPYIKEERMLSVLCCIFNGIPSPPLLNVLSFRDHLPINGYFERTFNHSFLMYNRIFAVRICTHIQTVHQNGCFDSCICKGGVFLNDEKVEAASFAVTAEMLREGVKLRKGKKVFHKAVLA